MNDWLILVIAVVIHELGHYIFDWIYTKRRPTVKFNWFTISIVDDPSIYTIKTKALNHLVGVLAGLIPILLFNVGDNIFLLYIIVSGLDFASVYGLFKIQGKYKLPWQTKIKDIPCDRCKELEEKIKMYEYRMRWHND